MFKNVRRYKINPLIFFLILALSTAVSFHVLAAEPDPNDIQDDELPKWCPPALDAAGQPITGLVVICGTVVTNHVAEVMGTMVPNVPVNDVLVAAYEENPLSPTGKMSGALTNIFSSTVTNKEGHYRLLVRSVKPPRLKVHLLFMCGGSNAQHLIVDSWHNTWNLYTQVGCEPTDGESTEEGVSEIPPDPPFPLSADYNANFLGCTNDYLKSTPIGLAKAEEPVINNLIVEENYDPRFTLNTVPIVTTFSNLMYYFTLIPYQFTSPGGLWEPDCLLRNELGVYQCNALSCVTDKDKWTKYQPQPCTDKCDPDIDYKVTPGYIGAKLYARADCHDPAGNASLDDPDNPDDNDDPSIEDLYSTDPAIAAAAQEAVEACKRDQEMLANRAGPEDGIQDPVDGILCDLDLYKSSEYGTPTANSTMIPDDYLTRPFFKFIPKSVPEYSTPHRRFEYRNNMQNFAMDLLTPMQWINTYIGSSSNTSIGGPGIANFRGFMGEVSTTPDVPACNSLYTRNLPFADAPGAKIVNRLINAGFMTALAEPEGTLQKIYYSGHRNLSDYVCEQTDGTLVRLCEIQTPWGDGALCNVSDGNCKDPDLRSQLNKSLNKLDSENSLIDPIDAQVVEENINESLTNCTGAFKVDKKHFAADLIFKVGNTQMGFHSDTPNDSLAGGPERRESFWPAKTEQRAPSLTGSRVVLQGGGKFMPNSFNTIACAVDSKWCTNDPEARNLADVLNYPYLDEDKMNEMYYDNTTWSVDSAGPSQTSMCSISNIYQVDITGPAQELAGMAEEDTNADRQSQEGGMFDQLYTGNSGHTHNLEVGTANWYMSAAAENRDKATSGACPAEVFTFSGGVAGTIADNFTSGVEVGTESDGDRMDDYAFAGLCGRDIWDSILTLAGGDAKIHNLNINLLQVEGAIIDSLGAESAWKSYGDRKGEAGESVDQKPYYSVTFEYPIVDDIILEKFNLPGYFSKDRGLHYVPPDLMPWEWGPGHVCYNFDIEVPQGHICGTTREDPEGISRTCRLDKCVAFNRVETAKCTCEVFYGENDDGSINYDEREVECEIHGREKRNLIIDDCVREDRLWCAVHQESSDPYDAWPAGYDKQKCLGKRDPSGECLGRTSPYYRDKRSGTGDTLHNEVLPPEDIDRVIEAHDDHMDTPYDAEEIERTECHAGLKGMDLGNNVGDTDTVTLVGVPGKTRPRCWMSVAGPFRRYPGFTEAGEETPVPVRGEEGQTIKSCNGYIRIEDSALRATQSAPFKDDTDPLRNQVQRNLDESTRIGIRVFKNMSSPYAPTWGGNRVAFIDAQNSNNNLYQDKGLPNDTYLRGQMIDMGGVGDVSTLRNLFTYPIYALYSEEDKKLKPVQIHCDPESSYTPNLLNEIQPEILNVLEGYDPDLDGIDGWKCLVVPHPDPHLPNIEDKPGNCGIPDPAKCAQAIQKVMGYAVGTPKAPVEPFKISSTLLTVLNWAGYQSNTPAAAFLTVMALEGGLDEQYKPLWMNSAAVYNAGVPWFGQLKIGGPATCNDLVWTAQGPYQLIKHWVEVLMDPELNPELSVRFCSSLNKAGAGRCESVLNAGRCNYIDATMITAYLMNPDAGNHPGSCEGFNMAGALALFSGGSYANEGVNTDSVMEIYSACGGLLPEPVTP